MKLKMHYYWHQRSGLEVLVQIWLGRNVDGLEIEALLPSNLPFCMSFLCLWVGHSCLFLSHFDNSEDNLEHILISVPSFFRKQWVCYHFDSKVKLSIFVSFFGADFTF